MLVKGRRLKTVVILLSSLAAVMTGMQAATVTWDDGAEDDNWSSPTNWVGDVSPTNGDSVVLTATPQSRLDYAWTIENGQSLTTTAPGSGDELVLQSDSDLTLATGGTMDIGFMRPRYSSGGQFTIEPGASLNTDAYGLSTIAATITFEADAQGVTTWTNTGQFQMGGDDLVVDLSSYDLANGTDLVLVDYASTNDFAGQTFGSVTVTGGKIGRLVYDYDLGGGDLAIALTDIVVPVIWDDGAGDDYWSSPTNWVDDLAPTNGDSVVLTNTTQSFLDYDWTIESGRSLAADSAVFSGSGYGDDLGIVTGGSLTLAAGGTMNIGFMRPRSNAPDGGNFTIEAGASLNTMVYGLSTKELNITYLADVAGVTTWFNSLSGADKFQVEGDNLTVDLSRYDIGNGTTLVLVDYADAMSGAFASTNLTSGWTADLDYAYDQGGGDLAIALTNIVELPKGMVFTIR
jgi:hypothetical protein